MAKLIRIVGEKYILTNEYKISTASDEIYRTYFEYIIANDNMLEGL